MANTTENMIHQRDCEDEIKRDILDTYEKIVYIITQRIERGLNKQDGGIIDLSNSWISVNMFSIEKLHSHINNNDIIEKINKDGYEKYFIVKFEINLTNSIIEWLDFYLTEFTETIIFENTRIFTVEGFRDCIIDKKMTFNPHNSDFYKSNVKHLQFKKTQFKKDVLFSCQRWEKSDKISFDSCIFDEKVEFQLCNISRASFTSSVFNSNVIFSGWNNVNKKIMLSNMDFSGSHFYGKLKIWYMTLGEIIMQNCHFYNTVNISHNLYDASFSLDTSFSTFKALFFIDSDLGDDIGDAIRLQKSIVFHKTLIEQGAFIFIRNVNTGLDTKKLKGDMGVVDFEYSNILGTVTIQDSNLDLIKLNKSTLVGNINIEDVITEYDCRKAITKIKNEYIKRNDKISALEYNEKEMEYYSENFMPKHKWPNIIVRFLFSHWYSQIMGIVLLPILLVLSLFPIEKLREFVLLFLNKISNSFGLSWGRGIIFTIGSAFLFYSLYALSTGNYEITCDINNWVILDGGFWVKVLNYLWIPSGIDELKTLKMAKWWNYALFILGKIFIGYGIYQTISAFRKYGK